MDLKSIVQAKVYDADVQLRGLIGKFEVSARSTTTIEHGTLGMVGVLEVGGRPLKPVTGKIMMPHLDDVYDGKLSNPGLLHSWQLHQDVDVFDTGAGYSFEKSHTIVHDMDFQVTEATGTTSELGEKAEGEYAISIPRYRIFRLGESAAIWELDIDADLFEVLGQPVWRQ